MTPKPFRAAGWVKSNGVSWLRLTTADQAGWTDEELLAEGNRIAAGKDCPEGRCVVGLWSTAMMYVREPVYRAARPLSDPDAEENLPIAAESCLQLAARNPYDGRQPSDAAHWAAQGVLSDLTDRGGLEGFGNFEDSVREEIVASLATIIRLAMNRPK